MSTLEASRDSAFRILQAASRFEIREQTRRNGTAAHRFEHRLFLEIAVLPFCLSLLFAGAANFLDAAWLRDPGILSLLVAYVGVFVHPLLSAWIHRRHIGAFLRHPFGVLLNNAVAMAAVDLRYLPRLERKPLQLLEVTSLEIEAERRSFERRISLVIGAIDKVGLAPGLLATFLSLHQLPSTLSQLVLALAYATPALYFFGAMAHLMAMRLDRMSKLLDLAVARKKASTSCTQTA